MFQPKYTITNRLLENITRITTLVAELNMRRFPHLVLLEFEKSARTLSTFASTSIEGNPLPLTEVKRILKSKPEYIRDTEKEVLNYNEALQELNEKLTKGDVTLSIDLLLSIQKKVTQGRLLQPFQSGKLREVPIFVNDPRTGRQVYLPPDAKDVKPLLEELFDFMSSNKRAINPLILAGILHKQIVFIHPFIDGNGRTTRLITKVLLAQMGLNTFNLFSFENYYNQNVTKYFQTVGELGNYYELVDTIDFTSWLEYFTEGIINELLRVQKLLAQVSGTPETELKPYHNIILDTIRTKGFINDADYAKLTERARATRTLDFQKLIDLELIMRKGKGKATHYVLKEQG